MGFQRSVNREPSPAVEGDFASANPRASMLAGPGALTAAVAGLIVGRFGFSRNDNGITGNVDPGVAYRIGFIHRDQPALITAWLGESSMVVPSGLEITSFVEGDFWCRVLVTNAAIGNKVFASLTDGTAKAAAAGATVSGYIETQWFVHTVALAGELMKISTRGPN